MSYDSVGRKGPEQTNPETDSRLVVTGDWWWGLRGVTLEPGCAVLVPCATTQATSTHGEWRRVHSVAYPAGCPGSNPPTTHSLLVSAWVPSWPGFPRLLHSPPTRASSLSVFPDQLFLLGSTASSLEMVLVPC